MGRIYSSSNKIRFTSISDKYQSAKSVKGKLSELHAMLITYVASNFKNTRKYKQQVVDVLNIMTYAVYSDDPLPFDWRPSSPFENVPEFDEDLIESTLGDIFLTIDSIDWDLQPVDENTSDISLNNSSIQFENNQTSKKIHKSNTASNAKFNNSSKSSKSGIVATPKQDLYIQSPTVPRFDYSKKWL
mgnify:CR=1 FL=1